MDLKEILCEDIEHIQLALGSIGRLLWWWQWIIHCIQELNPSQPTLTSYLNAKSYHHPVNKILCLPS